MITALLVACVIIGIMFTVYAAIDVFLYLDISHRVGKLEKKLHGLRGEDHDR